MATKYSLDDVQKVMIFANRAERAARVILTKHLDDRNYDIRLTDRPNDLRRDPQAVAPHSAGEDAADRVLRLVSDAAIGDETMQGLFAKSSSATFTKGIHDESAKRRSKGVTPTLTDAYVEELYLAGREAMEYAKRYQEIPGFYAGYVKSDAKADVRFANEYANQEGIKDLASLGEVYQRNQLEKRQAVTMASRHHS